MLLAALGLWTAPLAPARADEAAGHYNLALQYKREGKLADAIAECQKALQARPDYAAAHMTLGNLYRGQADYTRAAGEFEKAVKLQPKDPTAHGNLGAGVRAASTASEEGIRELETALDLKPRRLRGAASPWASPTSRRATTPTPSKTCRRPPRVKPDAAEAWTNLGIAKSKTDDHDGAVSALRKAITLRPEDADLHFDLAVVFRRDRKTDEAIAEYRLALEKDPKLAKAYYDLGILYSQEKKTTEAKAAFENYLKYGTSESAADRKEAEDRLKTFKGYDDGKAATEQARESSEADARPNR